MSERNQGVVKWFNNRRGYGFIDGNGEDVFVHYRSITGDGYKSLNEGQQVEYTPVKSDKGIQAEDVVKL